MSDGSGRAHVPSVAYDYQERTVEPRCSCGWIGVKRPYWPQKHVDLAYVAAEMHIERMLDAKP